jgi:glutathione peroxidase
MVQLYSLLNSRGFEILAFPSNEFGSQEPHPEDVIEKFARGEYKVTFPIFGKIKTNGKNADPVFRFLKSKLTGVLGTSIKWNFTKFLCNRDGIPVKRYGPPTNPLALVRDIEALLGDGIVATIPASAKPS